MAQSSRWNRVASCASVPLRSVKPPYPYDMIAGLGRGRLGSILGSKCGQNLRKMPKNTGYAQVKRIPGARWLAGVLRPLKLQQTLPSSEPWLVCRIGVYWQLFMEPGTHLRHLSSERVDLALQWWWRVARASHRITDLGEAVPSPFRLVYFPLLNGLRALRWRRSVRDDRRAP